MKLKLSEAMLLSQKQKDAVEFLKSITNKYFNLDTLSNELRQFFGHDVHPQFIHSDCSEWNILFNIEDQEVYAWVDLYVLKLKRPNLDGAEFMITSFAYEFE